MLDIQRDKVVVTQSGSNEKVDLSHLVPALVDTSNLHIDFNWSDARVALAAQGPVLMKPISLACHFLC